MTSASLRPQPLPRAAGKTRLAAAPLLALSLALVQGLTGNVALAAAPSQTPLLSRVNVPPAPNMMITIDDSGSMQTDFIPEGNSTVNGVTVTLPSQYNSLSYYFQDVAYGDPTHSAYGGSSGTVLAVKGNTNVYQRQMRSADVNRIYYDPDVQYKPWYKPDGTRMANATPSSAYWDVTATASGSFNLTVNRTGAGGVTTTWWTAVGTSSNVRNDWHPGLYYVLRSSASPALSASYDQYDVNATDGTHAPGAKGAARADCVGAKCTQAEELQNFANWFQYYRSRILLTKAALSELIGGSIGNVRFGLASINSTSATIDNVATTVIRQGVRDFSSAHRNTMLTNLQGIAASGGTPLLGAVQQVGEYFKRASTGSPWLADPLSASSGKLSCRRSYNILMTDGYYNDSISSGNIDNTDGAAQTLDITDLTPTPPDHYIAAKPYRDANSNTLADMAMKYYVSDLQTGVLNQVPPITGDLADPAYWQHLSQFTVGLGVSGTLAASTPAEKSATLARLTSASDTLAWPAPVDSNLGTKIDDLWHAAVNTRGDFFLANNSTELTDALSDAVGRAAGVNRVEGGLATTSRTLAAGTLKFVPTYQSGAWWGDVKAYELLSVGGVLQFSTTEKWKASDNVPSASLRNIMTWDGTAGAYFKTTLSSALKTLIAPAATQDAVINYVRGDTSNEGSTSDKFRARGGKKLPDFINSTPVYVKNLVDLGYPFSGYSAFVATKQSRTSGVVFVGGNGGMLHGFADSNGTELMAYVPKAVFPRLAKLTAQDYGSTSNFHQYFVDGPLLETDAFVATKKAPTAAWANLLIGGLGAGGTGMFALDVTNLGSFDTDNVLWEVSSADSTDMGYIFNKPAVGRLGGRWVAIFGNGANSAAGKAVLYVIDIETRVLSSITLDSGSGNGAMGATLILNGAKEVLGAYVGDLKGNMWRVDFAGSATATSWSIGFNGAPLYVAKDAAQTRQPITTSPAIKSHYQGGNMVLFGTGKLIETTDPDSKAVQSFYGVWDKTLDGVSSVTTTTPDWDALPNQRTGLQEQTITANSSITTTNGTYFTMSQNPVDWTVKRGWYMDFSLPSAASGQRLTYDPLVLGEFVAIFSVVPGAAPQGCDSSSGTGYNFLIPALTGAMYSKPVFDTNGDGVVDAGDQNASIFVSGADGAKGYLSKDDNTGRFVDPNDKKQDTAIYCINDGCVRARVWRQIVNPPTP